MNRPRVIVSVVATVDGRVALNRTSRLLDPATRDLWQSAWPPDVPELLARRAALLGPAQMLLEGSGTFVPDDAPPLVLPGSAPAGSYLPVSSPRWFAVVDGRGRMRWTFTGDDTTRLLVVVCAATPPGYLAFLRTQEIPYLSAGADRVDLAAMLASFGDRLGASTVVSEAGGGLNGALLRAGLVDELHVITVPALIGGLGTPSVMDGPPLADLIGPTRLRTVDVQLGEHGSIWSHYEVL